ncbi:MAG: DRTGG domain-containing protein [Desulfobacteraceae bacterium]
MELFIGMKRFSMVLYHIEENEQVMKLAHIKEILRAEVITGDDQLDMTLEAGTASDLMSDMLTGYNTDTVLLTGLCNAQVIRTSVIAGVKAIVFVRRKRPSPEVVQLAVNHHLPLLSTAFTMFSSCGRLFAQGLRGVEGRVSNRVDAPD